MATKSKSKTSSKSTPIKAGVDKDSSVSVSQIENGYLVNENGTRGKGRNKEYYSKTWYSKTNPVKINGNGSSGGGMKFGGKR